jgi:predicted nucleic acid-binding protein
MRNAWHARRASAVFLVDSTIWVAAERGLAIAKLVGADETLACCPVVLTEVLRGTRINHYVRTRAMLMKATMLDSPTPLARFEEAAQLYLRCHSVGITPSVPDCLVAACAIAHDIPLLHEDLDFLHIARVAPLKLFTRSSPSARS